MKCSGAASPAGGQPRGCIREGGFGSGRFRPKPVRHTEAHYSGLAAYFFGSSAGFLASAFCAAGQALGSQPLAAQLFAHPEIGLLVDLRRVLLLGVRLLGVLVHRAVFRIAILAVALPVAATLRASRLRASSWRSRRGPALRCGTSIVPPGQKQLGLVGPLLAVSHEGQILGVVVCTSMCRPRRAPGRPPSPSS